MDDLIARPEELRYKELKAISELLNVPGSALIRLFDKGFPDCLFNHEDQQAAPKLIYNVMYH